MDTVSPETRSRMMRAVRHKHTAPEIAVRRTAHALGFRFRLHRSDLPGTPDLVFPRLRRAIMVHGCFWHRHPGCSAATTPKANSAYWIAKFDDNVQRDAAAEDGLRTQGWEVLVVWECHTRSLEALEKTLAEFLSGSGKATRTLDLDLRRETVATSTQSRGLK